MKRWVFVVDKRGQVWIETVTYTLVAFVLIGLVLSFAQPKIESLQDQAVIDQSFTILKQIDLKINEVDDFGVGNKRKLLIEIRKGAIDINATNDSITFGINGKFMYSQPGQPYSENGFDILTTEFGRDFFVSIGKTYENINITYNGEEVSKTLPRSASAYTLFITNNGGAVTNIDIATA